MLNNINNSSNGTAFKANLRITAPIKDKVRLDNIQKLFSEKTPKTKETLSLSKLRNWDNVECVYLGKDPEKSFGVFFKSTFESMMETMSDSDLADKMVKALKAFKALSKRDFSTFDFGNEKYRVESEQKRNLAIAKDFRDKNNEIMAKRFEVLAECFGKKLTKIKKEEEKIDNKFLATIAEIAQGDEDILNFKDCM